MPVGRPLNEVTLLVLLIDEKFPGKIGVVGPTVGTLLVLLP